jgi:DNA/RNA endonuclease YhcR with UshA esterase domain
LLTVTPNENNIKSYGQMLDMRYINENSGVSIKYASDWNIEEKTLDDATGTINFIVELQPNNDEAFNSIVGIELDDISHY